MAPLANLSREEKAGLFLAGAAHVALAIALMVQPDAMRPFSPPQRIDVSLATEVSLESTAPDPSAQPAAAMAPVLSDLPVPETVQQIVPEPQKQPDVPRPPVVQRPVPQPSQRAAPRPTPTPAPRATQTAAPRPQPTQTQAASSSRLNDSFLEGMSDASGNSGSPAREAGPSQRASIAQAVQRQLKPHWNPPSGLEVDRLVTVVRFRLNEDGSLAGNPTVVRTEGQTAANSAQVGRHQEQAVRAVRLAAPFNLPAQYFSVWRSLETNFDNRLAQ